MFGFEFNRYIKNNIELDALGFDKGTYHIVEIKPIFDKNQAKKLP